MVMFQDVTPQQQRSAMSLALLSAAGGLLDSRGTYGNAGTSINRGIQQGIGTYLPVMQFMSAQGGREEDKAYQKERDKIADEYRDQQLELNKRRLDIAEKSAQADLASQGLRNQMLRYQFDMQKEAHDFQKEWMNKFTPSFRDQMQGAATQEQQNRWIGGAENQLYNTPDANMVRQATGNEIIPNVQSQASAQTPAQFGMGMDPLGLSIASQMPGGSFLKPMAQYQMKQVERAQDMNDWYAKEQARYWMAPYKTVTDPMGLGFINIDKRTGRPVSQFEGGKFSNY